MAVSKVGTAPNITYDRSEDEEAVGANYQRRWRHQKTARQELKGTPGDATYEVPQFSVPSGYRLISVSSELRNTGVGQHVEVFEKLDAFTTTTTTV
jgi:hypothetical protein